jgi:hypothetical protein
MQKNNIKNPLTLSWDGSVYKVNKPDDQCGEYVSKEVADELLAACKWAKEQFLKLADQGKYPEFMLQQNGGNGVMPLSNAINKALE